MTTEKRKRKEKAPYTPSKGDVLIHKTGEESTIYQVDDIQDAQVDTHNAVIRESFVILKPVNANAANVVVQQLNPRLVQAMVKAKILKTV